MDAIVRESSTEGPRQYGLKGHAYPAEVIYSYPERTMPPDLASSVAAFCCPHGVRPELLERTPSMSSLNEVIYGQPYQDAPDHSFVFMMQVSDPGDAQPRPMYGVCCYARELVHRPPAIARDMFPDATAPLSRYTVAAPRCYCLLTRLPFFSLHFRLLHTLLGLERLDRMTVYAEEVALGLAAAGHFSSPSRGVTSEAPEVEEEQGQVGRTAGAFESYTNTVSMCDFHSE